MAQMFSNLPTYTESGLHRLTDKEMQSRKGEDLAFLLQGGAGLFHCLECFSILEGGEGLSWKVPWAAVSKEKSLTHMVASAYDPRTGGWGGRIAMSLGQPGLCGVRLHLRIPKTKQTHQATTKIPIKKPKDPNQTIESKQNCLSM